MARLSIPAVRLPNAANILAFLDMTKWSELGWELISASDDGYNVLVGAVYPNHVTLFGSYRDHPQKPVRLNDKLTSTAAGAYQFLAKTWDALVDVHGYVDFSPENQDRGCIELIRGRKALAAVQAGQIEKAIALCNREWASFYGSPYGQRTHSLGSMLKTYAQARARYDAPDFSNVESGTASTAPAKEE